MAGDSINHPLERLIFFSDAVFAIAITLLVIEIHVPHLAAGSSDGGHLEALARLIPNFVGFIISFAVIGMFWAGHHRAFSLARHFYGGVVAWNLMLLGTIAFMPFVTAYLSAHSGARVPAILYWSWLTLTAVLNLKVNSMATRPPMASGHVESQEGAIVRRRSRSVLFGAITSLVIATIYPYAAPLGMITIPAWKWLLDRMTRPASSG